MLSIILIFSIIQLSSTNHAGSRLLNSAPDSVNDHLPSDYNHAGSRSLLATAAETALAEKFAPVLRFDQGATSNSNGFPSAFNKPNGKESNQNMIPALSGIPTYFKVFRNDPSDTLRITSIGYYWYYEYQPSCLIDTVIPNAIRHLPGDLTKALGLGDIVSKIIPVEWGVSGAHNDDVEQIFVHIDAEKSLRSVTYYQHGGSYTVRNSFTADFGWLGKLTIPTKLTINDKTHPHVFIGRNHHGCFHNMLSNVGGCGWFADYRDGYFKFNSWGNLKERSRSEMKFESFEKDNFCKGTGCNWGVCETRSEMKNNWELCTPLTCKGWSTPCLPWGVSDTVQAAADINDKLFKLYDTKNPDCQCVSIPFVGRVCAGERIKGEVCYPTPP